MNHQHELEESTNELWVVDVQMRNVQRNNSVYAVQRKLTYVFLLVHALNIKRRENVRDYDLYQLPWERMGYRDIRHRFGTGVFRAARIKVL